MFGVGKNDETNKGTGNTVAIPGVEKRQEKIDHELAEDEFERFCESWEIDNDTENMSEEDRDEFNSQKSKLMNAIKRNRLVFHDDDESFSYTFAKPEKSKCDNIIIKRPQGSALIEMDRYKEREGVHKTYAMLGAMTGKDTKFFSGLDGIDLKVFMAVIQLFLAS